MNQTFSPEDLGEPALKVEGFVLWIHGRQFPESDHYWDGNWLSVTAHCGASVWAQGAIVMVTNVARFGDQCTAMLRRESSSAVLDSVEPYLRVSLNAADRIGHIRVQVDITPDHLTQSHKMKFEIDQSYLPSIIKQCSAIVQEYRIRGGKDLKDI